MSASIRDPALEASDSSRAGHDTTYVLRNAGVTVVSATRECGEWLEAHLRPSFRPDITANVIATVHVTAAAPAAFDALARRAGGHEHAVQHGQSAADYLPCFALDTRVVELPAWRDGDAFVVADADLGAFYRVRGQRVEVVGPAGDRRPWMGALRIVREILTAASAATEQVIDLHAAVCAWEGRAVLIAGPRHSGKTTLLAHAASAGAHVIANDRVLVDVGRTPPVACGIPTLVAVRPDTCGFFPALRGGAASGRATLLQPDEDETEPGALSRGTNVRSLSLTEFADRLGSSSTASAPLDAVVFPEVAVGVDGWAVEVLPAIEVLPYLRACAYGAHRKAMGMETVFGRLGGLTSCTPTSATLLGRLSGSVTFFRCRVGSQAYERPASIWLEGILRPAAAQRASELT